MATVDLNGNLVPDPPYTPDLPNSPSYGLNNPTDTPVSSAGNYQQIGNYGTYNQRDALKDPTPAGDPEYNARQKEFESATNWGKIESELKAAASAAGLAYDPSDLAGIRRNAGYDASHQGASGGYISALDRSIANARQNYEQRRDNSPGGSGRSGGGAGGNGGRATNLPGNQFDDAYSSMLESISKAQMGEVRSNPGLDQLMKFLGDRFTDLSTNPGYNADEMSLLNTQSFEPIEAFRRATQQRELERTARAGYLPSSGLTRDNQRQIDTDADRMRTVANRDLGIKAIDQRNADLNQALNIGQLRGVQIPAAQRGEELSLANLLYQMPRTAMMDALAVINGSPSSSDAFNQALQLATQNRYQDQFNSQQNSALWGQIGQILQGMFQ